MTKIIIICSNFERKGGINDQSGYPVFSILIQYQLCRG